MSVSSRLGGKGDSPMCISEKTPAGGGTAAPENIQHTRLTSCMPDFKKAPSNHRTWPYIGQSFGTTKQAVLNAMKVAILVLPLALASSTVNDDTICNGSSCEVNNCFWAHWITCKYLRLWCKKHLQRPILLHGVTSRWVYRERKGVTIPACASRNMFRTSPSDEFVP